MRMRRIGRGLFVGLFVICVLVGVGLAKQRWFEARCRRQRWPGRFLPAPGPPVHVWCEGVGAPVVLLESSGLGSAMQYANILPPLAKRTTACAWDRPGMGLSEPTSRGATAPELGDRIWAALAAAGVSGPFVVVGASAGGLITLYLARTHADRVVGVVLLDAVGPDAVARFAEPFTRLAASARHTGWSAYVGLLGALDPFHLSERDACLTYRTTVFAAASELISNMTESARLVNLCPPIPDTMPIVVLRHGKVGDLVGSAASLEEQQAAEPEWIKLQEALAAQSKRGRIDVVEGSGHLIANERPQIVVRAIEEVIESASERGAGR